MKKINGFTLIELIVVIAIIAILSAILIPLILGYMNNSRVSKMNSNARSVYSGAQMAIVDKYNSNSPILPDTIYLSGAAGSTVGVEDGGSGNCDLGSYLGAEYGGYFGFITNAEGTGCCYAIWSEQPVTAAMVQTQMTEADVKASLSSVPCGCNPLAY